MNNYVVFQDDMANGQKVVITTMSANHVFLNTSFSPTFPNVLELMP